MIIPWLNTPPEIFEMTRQYTVSCVYGILFICGCNLVFAILRGMGDSRHPFRFIAIASAVNAVPDLLFAAVFHMGPFGAALGFGVRGFWYGNALSGLVPFFVGSACLFSGRWRAAASRVPLMASPEPEEE